MCLPSQCSTDSVGSLLQFLFARFGIPLKLISIRDHIPEYQFPIDWVLFATIMLLSVLVLLVLASTFISSMADHKIMGCFAIQNSMKIFDYKPSRLNTLNGVRSLMMLWVILSHEYSFFIGVSENTMSIPQILSRWQFLIVESGFFAVDAFFFIGGFLVAYAFLKETTSAFFKYPLAILNRYLRLVPAYFVAILLFYRVFPYMGSGPYWPFLTPLVQPCDDMWKSLLFINNLTDNMNGICLGWGWYLQNDMQLFVYSILMLLIYNHKKMAGYFAIVWSMLASFAYTMVVTYTHQYRNLNQVGDAKNNNEYQSTLYIVPWSRAPPYLYGLLLGIFYVNFLAEEKKEESEDFLVRLKRKLEGNRLLRIGVELTGAIIVFFIMFIQRTNQDELHWSQFVHSLYLTYAKTLFVMGLSLGILPSILGVRSLVSFVMDTKLFNFVAKVSFCTYLLHILIIYQWVGKTSVDTYYSFLTEYDFFVAHSVLSILSGFALCLLVEVPCSKLQKMLMVSLMKKDQKKPNTEESSAAINESLKER